MPTITYKNLVEEAEKFRQSKALAHYMIEWQIDPDLVKKFTGVDLAEPIVTDEQGVNFAKFCQKLWEVLPDVPEIRTGAFFTICDFAEAYCGGFDEYCPEDEAESGSSEPFLEG